MIEEFEKLLLNQDWWILHRNLSWVGCNIPNFGFIEMPDAQLKRLEAKYNIAATRLFGG